MNLFKTTRLYLLACCLATLATESRGQNPALTPLPLTDLSAFKPLDDNWKLAGDVAFDPFKPGKAKTTAGTGILVNQPGKGSNGHLFTTLEHGDLELELDFMMAKNSNAGVYLQGRYEVQMFDSWGQKAPTFADAGAIYQRWDDKRGEGRQGYEGHPPLVNVAKAPGLWQQYRIVFRAPRFDASGRKTENARFVAVYHNGVLVQQNVELTGPTRAAAFNDEKPLGPLMIQGDHGAVAIRNIRYQSYSTETVTLKNLRLQAYEDIKKLEDFQTKAPQAEMDLDVLAHLAPASRDNFAGKITGTLHVPAPGDYSFHLNLAWIPMDTNPNYINGAGQLAIGDQKVLTVTGRTGVAEGKVSLPAGDHPFELRYFKSSAYWYARSNDITLTVSGPGIAPTVLKAPLRAEEPVSAILLSAAAGTNMQRGFMEHLGRKRTHVIAVGEPGGANYALDLDQGLLLQVWRGNFLETTPMWHGRGETQLALPRGSVTAFAAQPSLALLAGDQAAWPDSNAAYTNQGYDVTKGGRPIFKYSLGGTQVRETLEPQDEGRKLTHTFQVQPGAGEGQLWCRLAAGSTITRVAKDLYAVNDKQYYIQLSGKEKPLLRSTSGNRQELLLPIKAGGKTTEVKYSIVW
ncbi:MAG: 3-keto-disaccharide hydrolase [Adhaeribacter sp.]